MTGFFYNFPNIPVFFLNHDIYISFFILPSILRKNLKEFIILFQNQHFIDRFRKINQGPFPSIRRLCSRKRRLVFLRLPPHLYSPQKIILLFSLKRSMKLQLFLGVLTIHKVSSNNFLLLQHLPPLLSPLGRSPETTPSLERPPLRI